MHIISVCILDATRRVASCPVATIDGKASGSCQFVANRPMVGFFARATLGNRCSKEHFGWDAGAVFAHHQAPIISGCFVVVGVKH